MPKSDKKYILFLPQTGNLGASSRARVYEYVSILKEQGIEFSLKNAVSNKFYLKFINNPSTINKVKWFIKRFLSRISCLYNIRKYSSVFIQKETIPYFFPISELLIISIARKTIFDFDDAIFIYPKSPNLLMKIFRDPYNVQRILKRVNQVIVGNRYLYDYAIKYNKNVTIIPTGINTSRLIPGKVNKNSKICIGWIGSKRTSKYLLGLRDVFQRLAHRFDYVLKIVGGDKLAIDNVNVIYKDWSLESEVADIQSFDIGIMPLTEDLWTKGKGGYKLLQYMAAGIPAVATPIGINCEIIEHGYNGFLAKDLNEWFENLAELIEKPKMRKKMGARARETVTSKFSIEKNAIKLIKVLTRC